MAALVEATGLPCTKAEPGTAAGNRLVAVGNTKRTTTKDGVGPGEAPA